MIVIRALVIPFIIAAVLLCCCGPAAEIAFPPTVERHPTELSGGYSLGRVYLGGLELFGPPHVSDEYFSYSTVVDQAVVRIGWDEDFIVVERHPLGHTIGDQPDSSHPEWHIVVVSTGEVHTTYSYDAFLTLRDQWGVPDSIEMRDASDVYRGR
jgi:hypothetical protein